MKQPIKSLLLATTTAALILASSTSYAAAVCSNQGWKKVMKRGTMVVGVKADYKPWGYRNTSGEIVGMEADMAKIAADAMGVRLTLVAVQSSNRMQFLENGKIDMMIATMSDRPDRRKICRESPSPTITPRVPMSCHPRLLKSRDGKILRTSRFAASRALSITR